MPQKLDSFSKILLATGAINYMASGINYVNEQCRLLPDEHGFHKEGIAERDKLLADTVKQLGQVMEDLGNYMNGADCICPIDVRATKQAFQIIIHGKDNVDK